jgi:hypothetical protein
MGRVCSTHSRDDIRMVGQPEGKRLFRGLDVDGKIRFGWMLGEIG